MTNACEHATDLLSGAPEIAAYLGVPERRVRYLVEKGLLPPVFWMGRRMMARKSTLKTYFDRLEGK